MTPYDQHNRDDASRRPQPPRRGGIIYKHPILANLFIIVIVGILGLVIAYLGLGLFTKHGQTDKVPRVVNLTYSSAVEKLNECGFRVEIRDSVYNEDVRPGVVIDQFPPAGAVVKPGRKVYLYINSVHPKEVIIDPGRDTRQPALRGCSLRQAQAQLQELGFKNIKVEYVLGDTDRVVRVMADGKVVNKMQKVPLNAKIVLVVYNGRKSVVADSLSRSYDGGGSFEEPLEDELLEEGAEPTEDEYFEENLDVNPDEHTENIE